MDEEFTKLCREGLKKRLETITYAVDEKVYWDRLDYELGVIIEMGFPAYFLIVQDFINWAKDNRIPVGPGRGSAAGSIVAWSLKITNLDPLPYDLLFERFLNVERISMPDIDVDFCERRRLEVVKYCAEKYGHDRVAQITTFGTMKTKAVIKDVGRALGMTFGETDRIAKLIPEGPGRHGQAAGRGKGQDHRAQRGQGGAGAGRHGGHPTPRSPSSSTFQRASKDCADTPPPMRRAWSFRTNP